MNRQTKWGFAVALALGATGCYGETVEPGHRGLFFDPRHGGLQRDVLQPGYHKTGMYGRVDDFDITFSTKKEDVQTTSQEGLAMVLHLSVIYRPVISELYELDTEIGQNYYDEVVGPEFRSAARGVFARHSYLELQKNNEKIEDEIENDLRRRIRGKHVDVGSITLEGVEYAPEILAANRARLVAEQEAARDKTRLESEALRKRIELESAAEQAKLEAEQELKNKEHERQIAVEQASIDKTKAESESQTRLTRAKAEAEATMLLAKAHSKEQQAITPLAVQMAAYEALGKLGGNGTTVLLGDWSHVPSFLFPAALGATPYSRAIYK
ncbi:MAG TPA: SPFH domain-containing protein [Polyangiaceae bacterium]|jgi:regulator of protease activity HflC (stomatin/prohibitin superfamily)